MGLKGGDELLVVVKDDLTLVMPKPKRYARTLQGLAQGTYPSCYLKRGPPVVVGASPRARPSWLAMAPASSWGCPGPLIDIRDQS
jgi:hypothetical protein